MVELLIFIGGFALGAVCVYVLYAMVNKNSQTNFENLANKILKENSKEFSELNKESLENIFDRFKEQIENLEKNSKTNLLSANELFDKNSAQNKEKLEDLLKQFKEKINEFEKKNDENYKDEQEKLILFDKNMKDFMETGNKINIDTSNLISVLRHDNKASGRWGEIVLEKVLELSGLRKDEEYKIQSGMAEGRPDATVYLPEDKCIYIDSKTSFASWDGYVNAENDEERSTYLKQFVDSTKTHIKGLSKRDYSVEEKSPDYVLMFIPIESCYTMMFCDDCNLWNYAWENKVMPVSPSTLLAALKIINSFLVVDRQNKNALEISRICAKMIDKFTDMLGEMNKIRNAFNSAIVKLQGRDNIINQLEKIKELGVKGSKGDVNLPELID